MSCLARGAPFHGFLALVWGEFARTPEFYPAFLGSLPALARASADQLTLKFSQTAENGQHQPAMRSCRVCHYDRALVGAYC